MLDTRTDTDLTEEMIAQDYRVLWNFGFASYSGVKHGFSSLDNNIFAAATDEAEQTLSGSEAQLFNEGSWNAFNNPDNYYADAYAGIRAANLFLERSASYESFLLLNRDTISDQGLAYRRNVMDIRRLRNEARVLRAYYYFELAKRYGGVPLVTAVLPPEIDATNLSRNSFADVIDFVVSEVDGAIRDTLELNWAEGPIADIGQSGRVTTGVALALKSRALLYGASPLHNQNNDVAKWQAAASAAHQVIALNRYSLHSDYQQLFLGANSATSSESIWAFRLGSTNSLERANYPIGTPGGNSGVTPSQNLVSAYEYTGPADPANPYSNRDPRLAFSVVTNNSTWNGRQINISSGGTDDRIKANASKTGYYLKKFLNPDLNLVQGGSQLRSWIIFRYAEILLNYAEAMNEAYGPDNAGGLTMTARQAVNAVRQRPGVNMPDVVAANREEMRQKIKHERRIELAFEGHRFWDLLRWRDAESVLNEPLRGVIAEKQAGNAFTYSEVTVERRQFIAPKMYLYPIPETEVAKSHGVLAQNPGW